MGTESDAASGRVDRQVSLEWSEQRAPNADCHYNHVIADTPFGRFLLTWKGWKDDPGYGFDETPWGEVEYHGWYAVEEAQEWAAKEMVRRIEACFKANVEGKGQSAHGTEKE